MVFPNPDIMEKTGEITAAEVLEDFDRCIRADDADTQIEQRVMKKSERKAFLKVFKDLPSVEGYKKARYRGGRFYQDDNGVWHDRYASPTDAQTLMMNVIQRKLSVALGLHTRAMLSSDGKYIFLLICADE